MQTQPAVTTPAPASRSEQKESAINLKPLRDGVRELEIAARRVKDMGEAYTDLLKTMASNTNIAAPVIRSFIAARIAEDDKARGRKKRHAEQLSLLFDEVGT